MHSAYYKPEDNAPAINSHPCPQELACILDVSGNNPDYELYKLDAQVYSKRQRIDRSLPFEGSMLQIGAVCLAITATVK